MKSPRAEKRRFLGLFWYTHFRRIPKNMRNLEESSGGFSGVVVAAVLANDVSEEVEGVVEAGEGSRDVDAVDAIVVEVREEIK